jgi:hypothetical protein
MRLACDRRGVYVRERGLSHMMSSHMESSRYGVGIVSPTMARLTGANSAERRRRSVYY